MSYYYYPMDVDITVTGDLSSVQRALCNFDLAEVSEDTGFELVYEDGEVCVRAEEPQKAFHLEFLNTLSLAGLLKDHSYIEIRTEEAEMYRYVWRTGHHAVKVFPVWPEVPVDQKCAICSCLLSIEEEPQNLCATHFIEFQQKKALLFLERMAHSLRYETSLPRNSEETSFSYIRRVYPFALHYWKKGGWNYDEMVEAFQTLNLSLPES